MNKCSLKRSFPWSGIFATAFILLTCAAQEPAVTGSRLHQVELLSRSSRQGDSSLTDLAKLVIGKAYNPDIASADALTDRLAQTQAAFVADQRLHTVSNLDVTRAFDIWRSLIGDPDPNPTSPFDLVRFRASLAAFAPSLITKDSNGLPSDHLSPVEAMYLFDFIVAHGYIPKPSKSKAKQSNMAYSHAEAKYLASTSPDQRKADMIKIIEAHVLK